MNIDQSLAQLNYSQKRNNNQQQTNSGSTRGCRSTMPKLQLLAPSDQIAIMGEEQTFLLNIDRPSQNPIHISILEPYEIKPLWKSEFKAEKAGLISISLPPTIKFKSNTDYIFTATITCNPNIPNNVVYVRVLFQKKLLPNRYTNVKDNINYLLAEEIWYDALWIAYSNKLPEFDRLLKMQGIKLEE